MALPAVIHRRWAREFLHRAERASSRRRKADFLRLVVSNTVRAQAVEAEDQSFCARSDSARESSSILMTP